MPVVETNFFFLGDGMMLILIVLALILCTYVVERAIFLHSGNIKPQQFISGIISLLKNDRYNEAITICEETLGFVPNIIKVALLFHKNDPAKTEYATKNLVLSIIPTLERRLHSILLIGKIAPMISCIGSCIIFAHFLSAAHLGVTYVQSECLFTLISNILKMVSFGIFINICASIGYSFLYGRVQRLIQNMEWSYNEIMNFLSSGISDAD